MFLGIYSHMYLQGIIIVLILVIVAFIVTLASGEEKAGNKQVPCGGKCEQGKKCVNGKCVYESIVGAGYPCAVSEQCQSGFVCDANQKKCVTSHGDDIGQLCESSRACPSDKNKNQSCIDGKYNKCTCESGVIDTNGNCMINRNCKDTNCDYCDSDGMYCGKCKPGHGPGLLNDDIRPFVESEDSNAKNHDSEKQGNYCTWKYDPNKYFYEVQGTCEGSIGDVCDTYEVRRWFFGHTQPYTTDNGDNLHIPSARCQQISLPHASGTICNTVTQWSCPITSYTPPNRINTLVDSPLCDDPR